LISQTRTTLWLEKVIIKVQQPTVSTDNTFQIYVINK